MAVAIKQDRAMNNRNALIDTDRDRLSVGMERIISNLDLLATKNRTEFSATKRLITGGQSQKDESRRQVWFNC